MPRPRAPAPRLHRLLRTPSASPPSNWLKGEAQATICAELAAAREATTGANAMIERKGSRRQAGAGHPRGGRTFDGGGGTRETGRGRTLSEGDAERLQPAASRTRTPPRSRPRPQPPPSRPLFRSQRDALADLKSAAADREAKIRTEIEVAAAADVRKRIEGLDNAKAEAKAGAASANLQVEALQQAQFQDDARDLAEGPSPPSTPRRRHRTRSASRSRPSSRKSSAPASRRPRKNWAKALRSTFTRRSRPNSAKARSSG
jgi:hypothetical protein